LINGASRARAEREKEEKAQAISSDHLIKFMIGISFILCMLLLFLHVGAKSSGDGGSSSRGGGPGFGAFAILHTNFRRAQEPQIPRRHCFSQISISFFFPNLYFLI